MSGIALLLLGTRGCRKYVRVARYEVGSLKGGCLACLNGKSVADGTPRTKIAERDQLPVPGPFKKSMASRFILGGPCRRF